RLTCATRAYENEGDYEEGPPVSVHFFASCLLEPFCVIRNAVRARASSSFMLRFGSMAPGRMGCGSFRQWEIQAAFRREPTWVSVGPMYPLSALVSTMWQPWQAYLE